MIWGVKMRRGTKAGIVLATAAAAMAASLASAVPFGLQAGATKALSAPVFTSPPTINAKVGRPLSKIVKTKANPVATISVTGTLPPGVSVQVDNVAGTATISDPTPLGGVYTNAFSLVATNSQGTTTEPITLTVKSKLPLIRHVFVIMLENEDFGSTFGSGNTYLSSTLPSQGALLANYYGVGHFSNDNYTGFISGQPPTADNQLDCISSGFADFPSGSGQDANGIQQGNGCVYPAAVPTLANQLTNDGLTWKGYEEDMGNDPARESATCGHPPLNSPDNTTSAEHGDGYAARHDPFVYFHSIIDDSALCNKNVVPLGDTGGNLPPSTPTGTTGLVTDLQSVATTPNFSYITPNLCNDGHDYPCVNETSPDTSAVNDLSDFLQTWIPIIEASPAYQQDGLIEVTFDESALSDTTACCGETAGPAAVAGGNGFSGPGGGKIGTILISPSITPGLVVTKTSYNHYSSLASIEDLFGLPRLGEAKTVTSNFDKKIYNTP